MHATPTRWRNDVVCWRNGIDDVFGALPVSDAARAETLREVVANLTTHAPEWFARDGNDVCTTR